jgi:hypothetical protein
MAGKALISRRIKGLNALTATWDSCLSVRKMSHVAAFARDGRKSTAYGLITQTIPVGEPAFLLAAPKEQPAPETLRQTDRRRMGLWKVAGASSGARPPTK